MHKDLLKLNHFGFIRHTSRHSYQTRLSNNLVVPQVDTNISKKIFNFSGVCLHNNLPDSLKNCTDNISFKIKCKRFLIENYCLTTIS